MLRNHGEEEKLVRERSRPGGEVKKEEGGIISLSSSSGMDVDHGTASQAVFRQCSPSQKP